MTDSTFFVKSSPPSASLDRFNTLQICYRDNEDVHEEV